MKRIYWRGSVPLFSIPPSAATETEVHIFMLLLGMNAKGGTPHRLGWHARTEITWMNELVYTIFFTYGFYKVQMPVKAHLTDQVNMLWLNDKVKV